MNFGGAASTNPRGLIDSPFYKLYMKYFNPAERLLALVWRSMLAFRIIVVGKTPEE
jgi:hypothetical protein